MKRDQLEHIRAANRLRRDKYRTMMADRASEYWQGTRAEGHQAVYRSLIRRDEAYAIMEHQMEREGRST